MQNFIFKIIKNIFNKKIFIEKNLLFIIYEL